MREMRCRTARVVRKPYTKSALACAPSLPLSHVRWLPFADAACLNVRIARLGPAAEGRARKIGPLQHGAIGMGVRPAWVDCSLLASAARGG